MIIRLMQFIHLTGAALGLGVQASVAAEFQPAPQTFRHEIAQYYIEKGGAPTGPVALVDYTVGGAILGFIAEGSVLLEGPLGLHTRVVVIQ